MRLAGGRAESTLTEPTGFGSSVTNFLPLPCSVWETVSQSPTVAGLGETHDASPPPIVGKRRPGPKQPNYGIPAEHWPTLVQRVVEQKEPLAQ